MKTIIGASPPVLPYLINPNCYNFPSKSHLSLISNFHSSGGKLGTWRIRAESESTTAETQSDRKGFGGSVQSNKSDKKKSTKKTTMNSKKISNVARREPLEKPFAPPETDKQAQEYEKAFLLIWGGLGGVILTQGILLCASGFLPEEWDNFIVKYVYPAFSPTVLFFLAGTSIYGLYKYFGGGLKKS